jgi:multidrug efflux system membrane fusion protein
MNASRITAVALVLLVALWFVSGQMMPHAEGVAKEGAAVESSATQSSTAPQADARKPFRVAVERIAVQSHRQTLILSGRTEAEKKVSVMARTGGVITELPVKRGSHVKKNDVIAVLSDDAREAQVAQARALFTQKSTELEAKRELIQRGSMPRLELVNLESQLKAAEASLAAANAELDRGTVRAPWDGIITELPVDVGQAAFSFMGSQIATMVSLDPMLAVVEVAERKLAGLAVGNPAKVRLITGDTAEGSIRYVSKSASQTTRTYRVEVQLPNADGKIPDGITCEVKIPLAAMEAARVPRSALTFSSAGDLGVRTVTDDGMVEFKPVTVVEDDHAAMWVTGLTDKAQVIVQGQDFVREGQKVEAVSEADLKTAQQ